MFVGFSSGFLNFGFFGKSFLFYVVWSFLLVVDLVSFWFRRGGRVGSIRVLVLRESYVVWWRVLVGVTVLSFGVSFVFSGGDRRRLVGE